MTKWIVMVFFYEKR